MVTEDGVQVTLTGASPACQAKHLLRKTVMIKLKRKERRELAEEKRQQIAKEISQSIRDCYDTAYIDAMDYLEKFGGKEFKTMAEGEAKDKLINQRIDMKVLFVKALAPILKKYPPQEATMIRDASIIWMKRLKKFTTARKL